jgi:hypothetical protein
MLSIERQRRAQAANVTNVTNIINFKRKATGPRISHAKSGGNNFPIGARHPDDIERDARRAARLTHYRLGRRTGIEKSGRLTRDVERRGQIPERASLLMRRS